jgi:hypothetical protein
VITPEILRDQRKLAELLPAASKTSRPGPRRHTPTRAVLRPAATAQYATKPRKWSITGQVEKLEGSTEPLVHHRYPVDRSARQS